MFKKIMLVTALSLSGAAVVATGTLYAMESDKFQDKFLNVYLSKLATQISALPAPEGMAYTLEVNDLETQLKQKIQELESNNSSTIEAFRTVIRDEVENKLNLTEQAIREDLEQKLHSTEVQALLDNSLTEVKNTFTDKFNTYDLGIIGEHDLGFYKTEIENALNQTHFATLEAALDANESGVNTVNGLVKEYKDLLDGFSTSLNALTLSTTSKNQLQDDKLQVLVVSLGEEILKLENSITRGSEQTLSEANIHTSTALAPIAKLSNDLKDDYYSFKKIVEDFIASQSGVNFKLDIERLQDLVSSITISFNHVLNDITELDIESANMKATHTADIKAINDVIGDWIKPKTITTTIKDLGIELATLANNTQANRDALTIHAQKIKSAEDMEQLLSTNVGDLTTRIERLEQLTQNYSSLVESIQTLSANQQNMKSDIDHAMEELYKIDSIVAQHINVLEMHSQDIASLKSSFTFFEIQMTNVQDLLTKNADDIQKYAVQIQATTTQIGDILNTLDNMALKLQENSDRITANSNEIYASKNRIDALEPKVTAIEERLDNVENHNSKLIYSNPVRSEGLDKLSWFTFPTSLDSVRHISIKLTNDSRISVVNLTLNPDAYKNSNEWIAGGSVSSSTKVSLANLYIWSFLVDHKNNRIRFNHFQYREKQQSLQDRWYNYWDGKINQITMW